MPNDSGPAIAAQPYGHFAGEVFEIPVEPLLRLQGYRNLDRVRPQVRDIATRMAGLAEGLLAPESYYRRVGITACTEDSVTLQTGATFHSVELAKIMQDCNEAIVFVLTLGHGIDNESIRMCGSDEIVEALFLEMAGWVAVERATRDFAQYLVSTLRDEGLRLSRRLGPGYADWPLAQQADLFDALNGVPIKVELLESCAMLPKKSRSGIYGLRLAE